MSNRPVFWAPTKKNNKTCFTKQWAIMRSEKSATRTQKETGVQNYIISLTRLSMLTFTEGSCLAVALEKAAESAERKFIKVG